MRINRFKKREINMETRSYGWTNRRSEIKSICSYMREESALNKIR